MFNSFKFEENVIEKLRSALADVHRKNHSFMPTQK